MVTMANNRFERDAAQKAAAPPSFFVMYLYYEKMMDQEGLEL
jgi:hypothetical protein